MRACMRASFYIANSLFLSLSLSPPHFLFGEHHLFERFQMAMPQVEWKAEQHVSSDHWDANTMEEKRNLN